MAVDLHPDMPRRMFFRYPGSKRILARWILQHVPADHDSFNDVYGGSGTVSWSKVRSSMERYNDLNGELLNMLRVLRERKEELIAAIEQTYWAEAEMHLALEPCGEPLERARRFYARLWMARYPFVPRPTFRRQIVLSRGRNGASQPMTPAAKLFMNTAHLHWYARRLRGVVLEQMDALAFVSYYDNERAVFYVDPPYPKGTRARKNGLYFADSMTPKDHAKLAKTLRKAKGMVLVSGYARNDDGSPNVLYTELYEDYEWQRVERVTRIEGGRRKSEALWLSPRTVEALAAEKVIG